MKDYIVRKRVKAKNMKSAVRGETGEIISVEIEKTPKPEDLTPAVGFEIEDEDDE